MIDVVYINKYCNVCTRKTVLEVSTNHIDQAPACVRIKLPYIAREAIGEVIRVCADGWRMPKGPAAPPYMTLFVDTLHLRVIPRVLLAYRGSVGPWKHHCAFP